MSWRKKVGSAFSGVGQLANNGQDAFGINLRGATNAFGVNYDAAKQGAAGVAGYYSGGAYGAGMGGLGSFGGAAASNSSAAEVGGAGAGAYTLRPDGTVVDPKSADTPYAASDEYGQFAQGKRDSFYNQEERTRNATGQGWTKDQYGLAQAQYTSDQNRDKNLASISQWEQSRNPYYASLYQQMQGDQNKQAQQQYTDSLKQMQLQHAARGTLGGSQAQYNQSQLNTELAKAQAGNAQNAQNYVQGIRQGDQANAQNMRQQAYAPDQYVQKYYESLLAQQGQGSQGYKNLTAMQLQGAQDQQANQNNMSQIYGGQLGGTLGTSASYLGAM